MTSSLTTALSAHFRRTFSPSNHALAALAGIAMLGCAGGPGVGEDGFEDVAEGEADVASLEAPLRIGGGSVAKGFTCTNGTCTCDKSIENDCEDMSGVCRDRDIDALIKCIDGWLTTHCSCTLAIVAPKQVPYLPPTEGTLLLKGL